MGEKIDVARDGLVNFVMNAKPSLAAIMDFARRILSTAFAIPVGLAFCAKLVRSQSPLIIF
jgi:hypothetical protein